jgi:formylglycine-generating enzyme required for sulfatase activity
VTIATFQLARFEVSNRLYHWLADRGGIDLPPDPGFPGMESYLFDFPDYPAVNLNATEAERAAAVIGCRLPTAAEWEYAASLDLEGYVFSQYPWGPLDPVNAGFPANFLAEDEWESRALDGFACTAPVGSYPLSGHGLTDMAGNVAEWTQPVLSVCKVKGGSWISPAEDLLIGATQDIHPSDRSWYTGFRLAR